MDNVAIKDTVNKYLPVAIVNTLSIPEYFDDFDNYPDLGSQESQSDMAVLMNQLKEVTKALQSESQKASTKPV